jgi:hypothetical protein
MKDRSGTYVLMGAAADRASYEASQYEQGLLTYALLEGMAGAKLRDDTYVDIAPLLIYAADETLHLAYGLGGIQKPIVSVPSGTDGTFDIGMLSAEDRKKIVLRSPKARVLAPALIDRISADDNDLQLSRRIRERLQKANAAEPDDRDSASVVFIDAQDMAGAIRPSGLYSVAGAAIQVQLVLTLDARRTSTNMTCQRANLEACVEMLYRAIVEAAYSEALDPRVSGP